MNDIKAKGIGNVVDKFLATLILFFVALPIYWLFSTAFKTEKDAFTAKLFFQPILNNFKVIFQDPYRAGPAFLNSLIVSVCVVFIAIPIAVAAAYVFSRFEFKGSKLLMVYILSSQFIPPIVVVMPYYRIFTKLHLIDTKLALIIIMLSTSLPYAIWLLKGFVDSMPTEIEEAAYIDGCSKFQTLRYVVFPLVMPGVITTAVFCFIMAWNEFLFALILTRHDAKTLTLALMSTQNQKGWDWNLMSSIGTLVMLPMFVLSFSIRKHFVQGLTMGGVK